MKINSSAIQMGSSRVATKYTSVISKTTLWQGDNKSSGTTSVTNRTEGAALTLSAEARAKTSERQSLVRNLEKEAESKKNLNAQTTGVSNSEDLIGEIDSIRKMQLEIVKKILDMLKGIKNGKKLEMPTLDLKFDQEKLKKLRTQMNNSGITSGAQEWNRETQVSTFHQESESTSFVAAGTVQTADGREINFGIGISMSREFMEEMNVTKQDTVKMLKDPLVINMDTNIAGVSDQKFSFDIDSDGKQDSISYLNKGSGFLAYDKNGDGIINDGGELFGTKSGDGFADLSAYDSDNNGWIDESDDIYNKLRVWVKGEDGQDTLLSLKEADVGAIYLDNASTQFSLNDQATNNTNAVIQKTGVYLKESTGQVGTVQHVDFAL